MDRKAFFDRVRKDFYPNGMQQEAVDGLNYLLDAFEKANWPIYYAANALGTAWREVGLNFQPVREGFKKTDAEARAYVAKHYPTKYGKPTQYGGQYAYGRGFVQLTWALPNKDSIRNYEKADERLSALGLIKKGDLLSNFDLALRPDLAAVIMVKGMEEGWFTGKKCSDYLSGTTPDFHNARRIINGTDHAAEIATASRKFLYALQAGSYGVVNPAPAPSQPIPPPPAPPAPDVEPVPAPRVETRMTMLQRFARFFGN